jgi:hypothetical protein
MKAKDDERGALSFLWVSVVFATILFLAVLAFAAWAFLSRQDYKNNSDQKAVAAVEVAKKETATAKDNEYLEKEKYPLKSYTAPAVLGGITLNYPKTWSAYVSPENNNFFIFNPDVITAGTTQLYALKINVANTPYNTVLTQYNGRIQQGKLKATAYSLPKVSSVLGVRLDGEVQTGQPGSLILLPLRDQTIEIACQIPDNLSDFNNIILPSLTFNP